MKSPLGPSVIRRLTSKSPVIDAEEVIVKLALAPSVTALVESAETEITGRTLVELSSSTTFTVTSLLLISMV